MLSLEIGKFNVRKTNDTVCLDKNDSPRRACVAVSQQMDDTHIIDKRFQSCKMSQIYTEQNFQTKIYLIKNENFDALIEQKVTTLVI